jgi:hypothetical protein
MTVASGAELPLTEARPVRLQHDHHPRHREHEHDHEQHDDKHDRAPVARLSAGELHVRDVLGDAARPGERREQGHSQRTGEDQSGSDLRISSLGRPYRGPANSKRQRHHHQRREGHEERQDERAGGAHLAVARRRLVL